MEPEEIKLRFRQSQLRGILTGMSFLVLSPLPKVASHFMLTSESPPGWSALAMVMSIVLVFTALTAFVWAMRCPACACRGPLIQFHRRMERRRCRKCGVRLV